MKKIIKFFIISFMLFSFNPHLLYWETWKTIEVKVSEKVPWANCEPETWPCPPEWCICKIEPWFNTIQSMIWWIIKWLTAISALWWVLFIVVNWILLSMWWWENTKVKERVIKTLVWLILLLLSWVILSALFPWIFK